MKSTQAGRLTGVSREGILVLETGLGVGCNADVRRTWFGVSRVIRFNGPRRFLTSSRGFLSFRPVLCQGREQLSEKDKNEPLMTSSIFLILSSSTSCSSFSRLSSITRSFLFTTHWILSSIDFKLSLLYFFFDFGLPACPGIRELLFRTASIISSSRCAIARATSSSRL